RSFWWSEPAESQREIRNGEKTNDAKSISANGNRRGRSCRYFGRRLRGDRPARAQARRVHLQLLGRDLQDGRAGGLSGGSRRSGGRRPGNRSGHPRQLARRGLSEPERRLGEEVARYVRQVSRQARGVRPLGGFETL